MTNRAILPVREDGWARKKWSVSECRALTASGLLDAGSYELIEGEIVFKMSYARHGLPEYWVVAIPTRQLIVHRGPTSTNWNAS